LCVHRQLSALVLNFNDHNELVVSVPVELTLPATATDVGEAVTIDPKNVKNEERPLFDFAGSTCTHADWDDDGALHLRFWTGHTIDVRADEHHTAWELYGKYHGCAARLPHGNVRLVRHDLAEEQADGEGPA